MSTAFRIGAQFSEKVTVLLEHIDLFMFALFH